MLRQIEGSRAVAEAVALCRPDLSCAYPILPQTHVVEGLGELVKSGALKPCEFINVEGEFAAMRVAIGGRRGWPVRPASSRSSRPNMAKWPQ